MTALFAIAVFEGYYPEGPADDVRGVFESERGALDYVRKYFRELARHDYVQLLRMSPEQGVEVLLSDDNLFGAAGVTFSEEE